MWKKSTTRPSVFAGIFSLARDELPLSDGTAIDCDQVLYATGRDVEQDLVAAHKWFNLAAVSGYREAAFHRQQIAGEMSAKDIADAQRAAREWLRVH